MIHVVTGQTLIDWGFKPGKWFKEAIAAADGMARDHYYKRATYTEEDLIAKVKEYEPVPLVQIALQDPSSIPVHYNIDADTDFEKDNLAKVKLAVEEIARIPIVRAISVMPDACPTGPNSVPVGTVVVTENAIVPGWHSADICCSVACTVFPPETDPTALLDAGMKISHFGKGGRPYSHDMQVPQYLLNKFESNRFLATTSGVASKHFGTQGDGNHFFYVGRITSTGQIALVTHHGSRKPGATLYDRGIEAAQKSSGELCQSVHKNNLWIRYNSTEGEAYWEALQLIREWTKKNHFTIHNAVAKFVGANWKDRYWNEHNFVFRREHEGKNYFFHAKGATPAYSWFAWDTMGITLIPLNMAEPILIGSVNANTNHGMDFVNQPSLGFSPHGAGRNYSRSQFTKLIEGKAKQLIADVTSRYDVRAFSGKHDISEFPAAYKDANKVIEQIERYNLVKIVDKIEPIGCIMAGHTTTDWKAIKKAKKEKRDDRTRITQAS